MLFKNITILDENLEVREHMFVGTDGARIAYIGKTEPKTDYGRAYDGSGKLLMSAFYNCHGHSPMALMRGYGENMVLQDWLTKRIFPFEAKLDSKAVYWATLLTMAESLRFGIGRGNHRVRRESEYVPGDRQRRRKRCMEVSVHAGDEADF